jgi:hypothetical protein
MYTPEEKAGDAMLIQITCSLRFADDHVVAGTIQVPSRYQDSTVAYSGELDRLPFRFETANSLMLSAIFQSFARELNAHFSEQKIGDWQTVLLNDQWDNTPDSDQAQEFANRKK